jgi:DNA polymerase sigma
MAGFGELDAAIWEYQASQEISEEEASMRTEVIGRLQMLLSSSRVCPGAILKPYGSQVTGLQTKSSDIDLGFILPSHLQQHFSQQHVQHQREMVQRVLANMTAELGRSYIVYSTLLHSTILCSALLVQ